MKRFTYILILLPLFPCCLRAQGLRISPGAQVIVTGAPNIVLNNAPLVNNGYFATGSSTLLFTGPGDTYIGGNNPVSFYNLAVSIPSGELQLRNNATINGIITMNSGNLQLNAHTLHLGSSARINGERNESRITGRNGGAITITALLNVPHALNPGNIGVEISSEANLGTTVITRGHTMQNNAQGQTGIQRYFDIVPSLHTDAPATLRFFYFDNELGDNNKNELDLFAARPGQNNWTAAGKDYSDATGNWLLKSNIKPLQRFTLAPALNNIAASVQVYPNPSRDVFTLSLFSATEKQTVVSLRDQWGHILETRTIHCLPGINKTKWRMSTYAAGAYHLVFEKTGIRNITVLRQ